MSEFIPRSISSLEEEIAALEKEQEDQLTNDEGRDEEEENTPSVKQPKEPLSEDEEKWSKRYADLRRHQQKDVEKLKALQAENEALKKEKRSANLPTAEEAEEWANANPKAAAIIRALAASETNNSAEELSVIKEKLSRAEQEAKIFKAHPDFEELTSSQEFYDWADEQPKSVNTLIFSSDAEDVIWALDFYKKEKEIKSFNPKKEAAKSAISRQNKTEPKTKPEGHFSESQVSQMSAQEYEKNEAAIQKALADGTFIYDLSGAAR